MVLRRGVCAIVVKQGKVLLLHHYPHWQGWEFAKGGIEKGETEEEALRRELKEEIGVTRFKSVTKTRHFLKAKYDPYTIEKYKGFGYDYEGLRYRIFLAESGTAKIRFDKSEHDGYKWVSPMRALKMLNWKNQKDALKRNLKKIMKV